MLLVVAYFVLNIMVVILYYLCVSVATKMYLTDTDIGKRIGKSTLTWIYVYEKYHRK